MIQSIYNNRSSLLIWIYFSSTHEDKYATTFLATKSTTDLSSTNPNHIDRFTPHLGMTYRGYYVIDLSLVHAIIFILPCIILALFKLWTKIVAKRQAEIITRKLNEELVKLVWYTMSNFYDKIWPNVLIQRLWYTIFILYY